jgi:hypothetical protein
MPAAPPAKYVCPSCRRRAGVPIVFGLPGVDLADARDRGELVLGGCLVEGDGIDPDRHCNACGHEWRIRRRAKVRA